jgi:HEAT repeat protein
MTGLVLVLLLAPALEELARDYDKAVSRSDWNAVARLVESIGKLEGDEPTAFLEREFEKSVKPPHRHPLFRQLAARRRPGQEAFLQDHIGADEPYLRATALEALADVNRESAGRRAVTLLEVDLDLRVRRVALDLLSRLRPAGAGPALVRAAVDLPGTEQGRLLRTLRDMTAAELEGVDALAADKDPRIRTMAVFALSGKAAAAVPDLLKRARKDLDAGVRLAASIGAGSASAVRKALASAKGYEERYRLYELIARLRIRDPAVFRIVAHATTSSDKALRPKAAETLGHLGGAEAVEILAPLVKASFWQLRIGSARGLGATREQAAVPVLIEALHRARGRVGHEIAAALESLTGQPFGLNADMWEHWWLKRGAGFTIPRDPPLQWVKPRAVRDRYAFYGIEVRSEAVVFILDISGSMSGAPLANLKEELLQAIRRMPDTTRFNLVLFENSARTWSKRLVNAKTGRKRAEKFVGSLRAGGGTNLWEGLRLGLAHKSVDTIVILTDGMPSAGEVTDVGEIRRWFLKTNRRRMILVHAIALGISSPDLKAMAVLSGGTYRERR